MRCLILTLLLLPGVVSAQTISSVADTLNHGDSITIVGSGFGSKATAAPMLWDTFDAAGGVDGDVLYQVDSNWHQYSSYGGSTYENTESHSDSLSAANTTGGLVTSYYDIATHTDTLYVTHWWKAANVDIGTGTDYGIVKLCRLNSSVDAGGGGRYNGLGSHSVGGQNPFPGDGSQVLYNTPTTYRIGWSDGVWNAWVRMEYLT